MRHNNNRELIKQMDSTTNRGLWNSVKHVFHQKDEQSPTTFGQGSVLSAGGTSPLSGVIPPPRPVGTLLDARTALGISSVSRAVSIVSGALAQLPLDIYRAGESIELSSLIQKPDVRISRTEFLGLTANSLATYGNAYWRLHESVTDPGKTATIEVLNPELMSVAWEKGRKVFYYADTKFADWQVKHLMVNPGFEYGSNMVMGFGPIQQNRLELQGILDMHRYINNFFVNNGVPTGIITPDYEINGEQADAIRARWYEIDALNGIQIVPHGFKFQPISTDPEKAQFIAAANKAVTDVARMFGIPANLILAEVNGTSTTYSNVQDNDRAFVKHTLMPYAQAIEDAFTEVLPRGQSVKFNFGGFLRGSTKERYDAHKIAIDAGFLTINEVRELEDRQPLTAEGDSTDY